MAGDAWQRGARELERNVRAHCGPRRLSKRAVAATCPTIAEVLAVPHDASRAARIRSLFLGASAVLHDREDLWLATCGASPKTMSVVFESHQDERDLWPTSPSLADFVLQQYGEDSYLAKDVVLPADIAALPVRQGGAPLPRAFDPAVLSRRLH